MTRTETRIAYRGGYIRPRDDRYHADLFHQGARYRQSFKTQQEAKDFIARKQDEIAALGSPLTIQQARDAYDATARLPPGVSLAVAVEFYLAHHKALAASRPVADLVAEYLEDRRKANCRPRYLGDLAARLGRFAKTDGHRLACNITTHSIVGFLDDIGAAGQTRKNYRAVLSGFFTWAAARGMVIENPVAGVSRVKVDERIPGILHADQVAAIMAAAQAEPVTIPALALGFFAGIRPAEIDRLAWADIDVDRRTITIGPHAAKKRRQRYVTIPDNLAAWLALCPREPGPVNRAGRKTMDATIAAAGVTEWPNDAARHTFGSMHVAAYEDAAATALQMGHTGTMVLFDHYRQKVTKVEALEYWQICPKPPSP